MTAIFFVMRFDIAPIVIWILELPLDQEIGAVMVIRILLGFERGLVVVAVRRRQKWIRSWRESACFLSTARPVQEKPIAIPIDLKPRQRGSDTAHIRRTHWAHTRGSRV